MTPAGGLPKLLGDRAKNVIHGLPQRLQTRAYTDLGVARGSTSRLIREVAQPFLRNDHTDEVAIRTGYVEEVLGRTLHSKLKADEGGEQQYLDQLAKGTNDIAPLS
jgi:hypothetical protein